MKIFFVILIILLFSSCRTYIDNESDIIRDNFDSVYGHLYAKDIYNEYVYINKIGLRADKEVFYPRHYKLKLPKGIVKFYAQISENYTCIEYPSKQIICIKAKYLNDNVKEDQWKLINPDEETMEKMLSDYWEEKNYNFDNIRARNHRITKLYTNGIFSILLYNIKEKNFDHFLYMVKSIEEIKYKTPDN